MLFWGSLDVRGLHYVLNHKLSLNRLKRTLELIWGRFLSGAGIAIDFFLGLSTCIWNLRSWKSTIHCLRRKKEYLWARLLLLFCQKLIWAHWMWPLQIGSLVPSEWPCCNTFCWRHLYLRKARTVDQSCHGSRGGDLPRACFHDRGTSWRRPAVFRCKFAF